MLKRMISAVLVAVLVAMMTAAPAFAQLPVAPSQSTGLGEIEGCFAGEVGLPLLATIVFQLGLNCEEAAPAQK